MTARVLIVDDDALAAETLAELFRKAGLHADWSCSAEDAFARMKAVKPSLLVVDERLPGMGGTGLVHCLRSSEAWAAVPCVVLTAVSDEEFALIEEEIAALPPGGAMRKPEDPEVLLSYVLSLLEGEEP